MPRARGDGGLTCATSEKTEASHLSRLRGPLSRIHALRDIRDQRKSRGAHPCAAEVARSAGEGGGVDKNTFKVPRRCALRILAVRR